MPGLHFVDAWMRRLGHDYYVGLLSAAQVHGFTHQSPQVLQVVTGARLRDRAFGRVRFEFVFSRHMTVGQFDVVNTPAGTARVSSRETTALDLVSFPLLAGGLSNVATVLGDMLDEQALDPERLALAAPSYPAATAARVGWLLAFMAERMDVEFASSALAAAAAERSTPVLIDPSGPRSGERDPRWNVVVNAYPDEESS